MTHYPGQEPSGNQSPYGPPQAPQYGHQGYVAPQYAITPYGANQYAPNPYPVSNVQNGTNVPGLWSLGLGIATPLVVFIPFLGSFTILMSIAGVVLGILGLAMDAYRGKRAIAGWGLGINVFMLIVVPLLLILFFAALFPLALISQS